MNRILTALLSAFFLTQFLLPAQAAAPPCDYAIVVSKRTHDDPAWNKVVEALQKKYAEKYHPQVIEFEGDVNQSLAPLRQLLPRYACFVVQPDEAGRQFVVNINRLTRKLDDDPYTDVIWGIITGYTAADALRIASVSEPLVIHRGGSNVGMDLNDFDEGFVIHEGSKDEYTKKDEGGKPVKDHGEADAAKPLVDLFTKYDPQMFLSSGHATWMDLQIGFPPHKRGQLRCKDGVLYGVDLSGHRYPLRSTTTKIYMPAGNCLAGLIRDKQSMAVAWLSSGGVDQMIGYVVSTWYGRGGWGTKDYFFSDPGRYSLSDSFFFNNQWMTYQLQTRFPKTANIDCNDWNIESDPEVIGLLAEKLGYTHEVPGIKDDLGMHWDHDTVAFYGDPAWDARLAPQKSKFTQKLTVDGDRYTFSLHADEDCAPARPPAAFLPKRVKDIKLVEGQNLKPLVTDNFIMVMEPGKLEKGKTYDVVFTAKEIDRSASAAETPTSIKTDDGSKDAMSLVPEKYRKEVASQLEMAGSNRDQLIAAIKAVPEKERAGLAFLIANMPQHDLETLSRDFLLTNLEYAYRARAEVPWGADLPEEIFLNDVLPYASINEHRDNWRKDFYDRFMPAVKNCKTAGEAAILLNKEAFRQFDVHYSATKRPKPDQSPYESQKAKFASCTGLSVIAVDALRAVCVPARFAGVPMWTGGHGNHSWTEAWDGSWHDIGSSESTKLDHTWFNDKAAQADPSDPLTCVYATSYARTGTQFPLIWDLANQTVPGIDVTALYKARRNVTLNIVDGDGKPLKAPVTLRYNGHIVAAGRGASSYDFMLAGGQKYDFELETHGTKRTGTVSVPKEGTEPVELHMPTG